MTPVLAKSVLVSLAAAWPRAVPFGALLEGGVDEEALADLLASLFWKGVVDLHAQPPLCTETVSALPRTSALVRRQARAGLDQHLRKMAEHALLVG